MSSNAIRGMRRKKSGLCEVKIAVIGAPGVGKSGMYSFFFAFLFTMMRQRRMQEKDKLIRRTEEYP